MSNIFISYSSEDRDWARRLAQALEKEGWSVWWDRKIAVGKTYSRVIEAELEAADCVMVIWSEHSVASDWVVAEAAEGLERNLLVPVSIDNAKPPLIFRQIQTADLSKWDGSPTSSTFRQLAEDIRPLIAESKKDTTPLPPSPPPKEVSRPEPPPTGGKNLKWYIAAAAVMIALGLLVAWPYLKQFLSGQISYAQIIELTADPAKIEQGEPTTLNWKTENAVKVTLSTEEDAPGEIIEPAGTKIVHPQETTVFFLKAQGTDPEKKAEIARITVVVTPKTAKPDPKIVVFEAGRKILIRGESTALFWETAEASRIELDDEVVKPKGELEIRPDQTTTYRLIAVNESGKTDSKSITIMVEDLSRDEIAEIQKLLEALGYNVGVADGLPGQRTQAAIEAFQNKHKLPVTGLPSRSLAIKLQDVHHSVPAPEIIVFKSDRQKITRGDTLTLLWQTFNADKVSLSPFGKVESSGERLVQPADNAIYELEATNRVGKSDRKTISVNVEIPLTIESLTVDRQRIGPDDKTTIRWRTSGAEKVELIPFGRVSLSGSKIVSPNETTRYELIATKGTDEKKKRPITIEIVKRPEIRSFQADSLRVKKGGYVTLSWNTVNASKVELTGVGTVEKSGRHRIQIEGGQAFKLTATNEFGESASEVFRVGVVMQPRIDFFRSDKSTVKPGDLVNLFWGTTGAETVRISNLGSVEKDGERRIRIEQSQAFEIIATNELGEKAFKTLKIKTASPPIGESERPPTGSQGPIKIIFGGGPMGGTFHMFANSIQSYTPIKNFRSFSVRAQTSSGSIGNLRKTNAGRQQMSIVYSSALWLGRKGHLKNDPKKYDNVMAVAWLYSAPAQLVVKKYSGIRSTRDLLGKKVGVGNSGSGAFAACERFFSHVGIWDKIQRKAMGYNDAAAAFGNKQLDAFWLFTAFPSGAVIMAAQTNDIDLVNIGADAESSGLFKRYPFYTRVSIPARTYRGVNHQTSSFEDSTLWVANSQVPDEVVYDMLSVIYSNDGLRHLHAQKKTFRNMRVLTGPKNIVTPFHPGAEKFWREQGVLKY